MGTRASAMGTSPPDCVRSPAGPCPEHIWLGHRVLAGRDVPICCQRCEFAAAVRTRHPGGRKEAEDVDGGHRV